MKNSNLVFPSAVRVLKSRPWPGGPGVSALALAAALAFAGCGENKSASAAAVAVAAPKTAADYFPIKVGDKTVRMQLAVRSDEMEHGMMDRHDLGRDDGMIFVYAKPQQMQFWMHNTPTALDIGFFDAGGMLEEVYPMHPFDEKTVSSRSSLLSFALEMNQGWFGANTVRPGAQLDLKALAVALKARGFDPAKYGLKE